MEGVVLQPQGRSGRACGHSDRGGFPPEGVDLQERLGKCRWDAWASFVILHRPYVMLRGQQLHRERRR